MRLARRTLSLFFCSILSPWLVMPSVAQELEPRRWNHLPIDSNFALAGYAFSDADISFNPVLRIENATRKQDTWAIGYIRTFELFERTTRFEVLQGWQKARWKGLLNEVRASTERAGPADTLARFAVNLIGAPPLAGKEYAAYRAAVDVETILGAALVVQFPTGQYDETKLLNLGSNRFTFQPQLGVVHNRGRWSFEATAAARFYTENDSFFNGNQLQQDPFFTIEGHGTYTFPKGLWLSAGIGYAAGGQTSLNGIQNDDRQEKVGWAISAGYPVTRWMSIKGGLTSIHRQTTVGEDSQTFAIGLSTFW